MQSEDKETVYYRGQQPPFRVSPNTEHLLMLLAEIAEWLRENDVATAPKVKFWLERYQQASRERWLIPEGSCTLNDK